MYLPAFPLMARDFQTSSPTIALSLSSYFIGLALGQVIYGPLLDRFGRKPPLCSGLILFVLASIGCSQTDSIETLIALRFVQAIGGCVGQVAAVAMVRDFYPANQSARIYSLLFLFVGVSPLLAPSTGSLLMVDLGWRWVFGMLGLVVAIILALTAVFLRKDIRPTRASASGPDRSSPSS